MDSYPSQTPRANLSNHSNRYDGYQDLIDVERALDTYVIPVICALGMLGNLVNLLVLTRSGYHQSEAIGERTVQSGLLSLSVADFLFCLVMFPRAFVGSTLSLFPSRSFRLFYQSHGSWVVTSLILTSTWITVTLTTQRYLGICHPLRCRYLVGVIPETVTYLTVTLVCWGVNLPAFWQYHVTDMTFPSNQTRYLVDIGPLDYSTSLGMAFQWVRGSVGLFIPAVVLVYCNWALVRALRHSHQVRQHFHVNGRAGRSRDRVTLTLAAISVAFVLLVLPSELMDFVLRFVEENATRTEVFLLIRGVANTLQVFNFAGNFLLYCSVNSRFRKSLYSMFGGKGRDSHSSLQLQRRQFDFRVQRSAGSGNPHPQLRPGSLSVSSRKRLDHVPFKYYSSIGSMNLTEYKSLPPIPETEAVFQAHILPPIPNADF